MSVLPSIPGGSSGQSQSSSSTQMIPGMASIYQGLLAQNEGHYGNVLNAYQTGESTIAGQTPGIAAGYGNVNAGVQNTLGMGQVLGQNGNWGVAAPAAQAIGQAYAAQQGQTTQQMTNAGLGNTTAVGNAQTQNTLSAAQAYGGLGAQLAQTSAGYQAQEGNAALGARMQGLGMQAGLYGQALGPLGQQLSNTAGSLTGQVSNATSSQQAQPQQSSTQQAAQQNANNPLNNPGNLAGITGAAAGGSTVGGAGAAGQGLPASGDLGGSLSGAGYATPGGGSSGGVPSYNPSSGYTTPTTGGQGQVFDQGIPGPGQTYPGAGGGGGGAEGPAYKPEDLAALGPAATPEITAKAFGAQAMGADVPPYPGAGFKPVIAVSGTPPNEIKTITGWTPQ